MYDNLEPDVIADTVQAFLEQRLDRLVARSIELAKTNGYAPFTTTIRSAWVEANESICECLVAYMRATTTEPIGPIATLDYGNDPRFKRMRQIAQRHRALGITIQLYVGLLKHFQRLYISEIQDMPTAIGDKGLLLIRDFFDEMELSVCSSWKGKEDGQRLNELQDRARLAIMDKDRYLAVFESLRSPAFLLDDNGSLVHANQASASFFLTQDAQAGDVIYSRSVRPRVDSLKPLLAKILHALEESRELIWLDTLVGRMCFDVRMRDLHDAVGNTALGHVLLMYDVTNLQRQADEARQSEQGMSRFLAAMSHEIRTPLHSVLGATELLRTADTDNAGAYLDVIDSAGKMLLLTLNNVLDYSKFERERPVARPVPTDVVGKLRDFGSIAIVGRNLPQSQLSFEIDETVPDIVPIDWGMAQQVLNNLVSNAIKADEGKGVQVHVTRLVHDDGQDRLRFDVRDHGPGISEEAAAPLFRSFERVQARDTGSGGSGLGLAISHYLVTAMSGRIGYENRGDGTTVWFELPIVDATVAASAFELTRDGSNPKSGQISHCLLVDDDDIGAMVTAKQLEALGLTVHRASSVAEAFDLAERETYDLFVVDYLLPDGNGPAFVQSLKSRKQTDARFLALTANVDALNNSEKEFDEILAKPAGKALISEAIFGSNTRVSGYEPVSYRGHESLKGLSHETVTAMIKQFSRTWEEFRGLLRADHDHNAIKLLGEAAHRLAGNCSLMGLLELEPALRRLEKECSGEPKSAILDKIVLELDRDLSEVPSWRKLRSNWLPK
ncbi:MAG: ATP-binding protein [Thalassovita sp.]